MEEELFDAEVYTLTDDEGNEGQFELLAALEDGGKQYCALIPVPEDGAEEGDEYIVLMAGVDENGEECLVSIEDDEEFNRIADIFDASFAEMDYDAE